MKKVEPPTPEKFPNYETQLPNIDRLRPLHEKHREDIVKQVEQLGGDANIRIIMEQNPVKIAHLSCFCSEGEFMASLLLRLQDGFLDLSEAHRLEVHIHPAEWKCVTYELLNWICRDLSRCQDPVWTRAINLAEMSTRVALGDFYYPSVFGRSLMSKVLFQLLREKTHRELQDATNKKRRGRKP